MINLGLGYSKKDQRRVSERDAPHKTSVSFLTSTNGNNCSPLYYDYQNVGNYTEPLTKMLVNPASTVFSNYATRYAEYKVDSIDINVYWNGLATAEDVPGEPPAPTDTAAKYFEDAFFHVLYNPEKDSKPGEALASVELYNKLTAHPSTQVFRFRPPETGINNQQLVSCFSLRVTPKVKQNKLIDNVATEVFVNHPFIPVSQKKDLYCGGLWIWTTKSTDSLWKPLFYTEVTLNMTFRDSQFL